MNKNLADKVSPNPHPDDLYDQAVNNLITERSEAKQNVAALRLIELRQKQLDRKYSERTERRKIYMRYLELKGEL